MMNNPNVIKKQAVDLARAFMKANKYIQPNESLQLAIIAYIEIGQQYGIDTTNHINELKKLQKHA